jgi:predicted ATPase
MESRALITRVVLENYKSIAFCDVKLGPLSILVGPNGAGKSNFLDALRLLSEGMNAPAEKAFQHREGFSNVLRRGVSSRGHLGVRIEFATSQATHGQYSVRFSTGVAEDYFVGREKWFVGGKGLDAKREGAPIGPQIEPPTGLDLPRMAQDPDYPEFAAPWRLLSDCRFYNLVPESLRRPAAASRERVLKSDGSNLANVVHHISRTNVATFERIIQYLQAIYPALQSIESIETGGYRSLQFHESNGVFHPLQISDGTLRSLAVLVALFQRLSGAENVSVVGLEEPETALHPAAAGVLFDAMREASATVQVIATTHSADLLDKKEIDTSAILSVELDGGTTRIGHLDNTGRRALKQQLYTPGELMRMNYLRPEHSRMPDDSEIESVLFGDPVPA